MKASYTNRSSTDSPNGEKQKDCAVCAWRSEDFFCSLSESSLVDFSSLKVTHLVASGSTLFSEGETAHGVYVICSGRMKLTAYSSSGRAFVFRIAGPGEVLALSACMLGGTFEATAQALETCQVNYVDRLRFLQLMRVHNDVAYNAVRELSRNYQRSYTQLRSLALSASVVEKLTQLLLQWCDAAGASNNGHGIPFTHTHEEIAEMIGASRETITRALMDLRHRNLIRLEGATLHVLDRKGLEAAVILRYRSAQAKKKQKA